MHEPIPSERTDLQEAAQAFSGRADRNDDEGNRIKRTKTSTGEVTEYTWDFRNRLTKVTEKDASGNVTKVVEYATRMRCLTASAVLLSALADSPFAPGFSRGSGGPSPTPESPCPSRLMANSSYLY